MLVRSAVALAASMVLAGTVAPADTGIHYGSWQNAQQANDAGPSPSCVQDPENCPRKWTWTEDDYTASKWCDPGSTGWAYYKLPVELWVVFCCATQGEYRYVYLKEGGAVIGTQTKCGTTIVGWPG